MSLFRLTSKSQLCAYLGFRVELGQINFSVLALTLDLGLLTPTKTILTASSRYM
jgi:hypothetical protein